VAISALAARPASAGLADRIGATFGFMLNDFVEAFEPLEGIVLEADGDRLYLDLTEADKVRPGQELTVFRKGAVFHHPLTGKPLGNYEELLGYAQVRRVQARFSEALFIPLPDRPAPQPEDGVRITRGRIKVAVTPLIDLASSRADLRRVPFLISTALDRTKRFQVADPLAVVELFANGARVEELLARPTTAVSTGKALDVAWWVVPILIERAGVTYLDATWISGLTGTALLSRRLSLAPPEATEEQRFPWEPAVED
jgi:hypothetical protein